MPRAFAIPSAKLMSPLNWALCRAKPPKHRVFPESKTYFGRGGVSRMALFFLSGVALCLTPSPYSRSTCSPKKP